MKDVLVLLDVDGTLLLSHDELYVEANREALEQVYGVSAPVPDVPAETALAHTRRALRTAGLPDDRIGPRLGDWCDAFASRYVELLARADTSGWRRAPGAEDALVLLGHCALLTGNPEPIARARMERLRLAAFFPAGEGAFGCESERRVDLIALARDRAGNWPADHTVAVGDTPRDVTSAREGGARVVAVSTGRYSADELSGADAVISSLRELPDAIAAI
jgi:phosphoglycolate phosphatase